MGKTKKPKTIIGIVCAIIVILIAVCAYIIFGVVGIESKRSYKDSTPVSSNVNTNQTVIDDKTTYQTMYGFGASACWWAQDVGGFENSEDILSYLYDSDKGIGLNIYRYNLGAGSKDDEHIEDESRRTECFLKDDTTYDFSVDKNAQNCLAIAKNLAGDNLRVTLFCNSAPVSLTKNSVAYCSAQKDEDAQWVSNLDKSNYNAFADYCYNCSEYFLSEGYRVTNVSPINEPQYDWTAWFNDDGSYSAKQEGCYYSKYEARDLLTAMVERFEGSDVEKDGCKVSMFESGEPNAKGSTAAAYMDCILGKGPKYVFKNKALRDYFTNVSTHSYWASNNTKVKTAQYLNDSYSNYDVVCTEYCQMTNDENTGVFDLIEKEENGTNGMTIEYGVQMAKIILDDLTILNAKEWDWWTACAYGTYTDGLIYINKEDNSKIELSKRLWCLGNFSKFIEEGATRIACSSGNENLSSVAFKNEDNSTVIVYVNTTENDETTSLESVVSGSYDVYTTDETKDLEKSVSTEKDLTVDKNSVVTVVVK